MRFVRQPVRTSLRPRYSVRIVEKTDHSMHKVVGPRHLLVSGEHHLVFAVEPFGQLLVDGCGDKIGGLDR